MARYKPYSYQQTELIPLSLEQQILPGTFEHALNYLIDKEIDLSVFERRFCNDENGAPAYFPGILLKIVLYAYSRGITTSRAIARLCEENVVCMALSANTRPHFTTIANFISSMEDPVVSVFQDVLSVCASEGLIGSEMFAIDGCKLAANCSKQWSGTMEGFERKRSKLEKQLRWLVAKHRMMDERDLDSKEKEKEIKAIRRLREKVRTIGGFLKNRDDRRGSSGGIVQSNLTDNESAKMPSSHGVIQGYNGQAVVDSKHQVVVEAEAFGEGQDHSLLLPMVEKARETMKEIGVAEDVFEETKVVADAGYHSEKNMEMLHDQGIDAYVADNRFRKRDPAFATAQEHKRSVDGQHRSVGRKYFTPDDFKHDKRTDTLRCPAGKSLYVKNRNYRTSDGKPGVAYAGWKQHCRVCSLRSKCLRCAGTEARQVVKFSQKSSVSYTRWMINRLDTARGRFLYSRRMGIVEPVFAHVRSALGLDRFTLRGRTKVNVQWKLYALVHNLRKLWRYAPAFA